ncbi:unnamed protein product, partial [Rotaria sordida]
MSSINFIPKTTTLANFLPNINIPPLRPYYLTANIPPPKIQQNYQNLTRQIPRKPSLYGAGQRKYNFHKKFQIGTTTTFNGYTNVSGRPPTPPPRRRHLSPFQPLAPPRNHHNFHHHPHPHQYNHHHHHHYQNNTNNLPTLMSLNPFHHPPRHHTRSFHQAQHFHPNQHHP